MAYATYADFIRDLVTDTLKKCPFHRLFIFYSKSIHGKENRLCMNLEGSFCNAHAKNHHCAIIHVDKKTCPRKVTLAAEDPRFHGNGSHDHISD